MTPSLARRTAAEGLGTGFLLIAIVGSGIMAERLSGGNAGVALLANALATGTALVALICTFAPLSGAHFNPLVSLAIAAAGDLSVRNAVAYMAAQIAGAVAGVCVAHAMFEMPLLQTGLHERTGFGQWLGEAVATFGLLALIESGRRHFPARLPLLIGAYITAAYWFTSSTSFANPAVTLARALTDSVAGIDPAHVAGFIVAQAAGAVGAIALFRWLYAGEHPRTP